MSKPTNEPSHELIHKPTKRMDLDAKLPNNLSPTKTWVAYSEPKHDAELPIKVTDSTNTQTRGLCHDKKSEPESLAEQSIAATDSSQNILPAGLGLHLAKPTLPMALDPSGSSTTLPMTLDSLESFTTPAALDPSANSLLPAALDLSARVNISSIHSKEKLQKPSNLSAGLGLHSASTTNLSAGLGLHSASTTNLSAVLDLHSTCKPAHKDSIKRLSKDASASQLKQNAIHLSVDCWIKTNVSKETAARFGWLLIVENHYHQLPIVNIKFSISAKFFAREKWQVYCCVEIKGSQRICFQ
jgi:hypothetical protein